MNRATVALLVGFFVVGWTLCYLMVFHFSVFVCVLCISWGLALVTGVVLRIHWWRQRRKERERIPRAVGRMRT